MALYDNKHWLLSHIRNSFISTDDTGMCELVMVGEDLPKHLADRLDVYRDPEESEDEDDIGQESLEVQLDMDFGVRQRSNTAVRLEKMDLARRRAGKIRNIKWEHKSDSLTDDQLNEMFRKKDLTLEPRRVVTKSLLTEQLERCTNLPANPYMQYGKYDGCAQVGIPVRKYKIFLTMLPEEHRNYPMTVACIATATIEQLIGLTLLKCSTVHGDFALEPVANYGLYITEEDGEVDRDFPCLDANECVAKFGFTCLGLVEHKHVPKSVSFDTTKVIIMHAADARDDQTQSAESTPVEDEAREITANMLRMKNHTSAMEAPLYKSYRVYIVSKMRAKAEISLGVSGEKLEIDPIQQKNSKFSFVRQKPISHPIESIASCDITEEKSNSTQFRVYYNAMYGSASVLSSGSNQSPMLQSSTSFKHYDFEASHTISAEVVMKINLILDLKSSTSRKDFLNHYVDRKSRRKKSVYKQ